MAKCAKCGNNIDWEKKRFIAFVEDYLCESCGFEFDILFQDKFGEKAPEQEAISFFIKFVKSKPQFVFR